ncbi:MAG: hypothetical protein AAFV98_06095 [Chloroflexota bacterium]
MTDQQTQRRPQRAIQRKNRTGRQLSSTQVVFAVILAIAMMLAVQFSARIADERTLNAIQDTVEDEIALLRAEQTDLIDELDFVQSDAYVEEWAREEQRMVRDNMVLVIPVPASSLAPRPIDDVTSVPAGSVVETTLPEPEPWELWWALFFDSPPPTVGS